MHAGPDRFLCTLLKSGFTVEDCDKDLLMKKDCDKITSQQPIFCVMSQVYTAEVHLSLIGVLCSSQSALLI